MNAGSDGSAAARDQSPHLDEGKLDTPSVSWSDLERAGSVEEFTRVWLALQCRSIRGALRGAVVLGAAGKGPYQPVAYWPRAGSPQPSLAAAAEFAMSEQRGVVRENELFGSAAQEASLAFAYPLVVDSLLCGVVAIEIGGGPAVDRSAVMRQLQWGCGWLEALVRRKTLTSKDRLVAVLDLVAATLAHPRFHAAATALANELSGYLECEWVAMGFSKGMHIDVKVLSNSASLKKETNMHRAIAAAMDEAAEQQAAVTFPSLDADGARVTRAHAQLAEIAAVGGLCTVPLVDGDRVVGGLTLARGVEHPFDRKDIDLCGHLAALIGPILETKRRDDRWLIGKAWESLRGLFRKLFGPRHAALKLGAVLVLGLTLFFAFAVGDYRVSADAYLQGSVQRVVTAPMDGYIDKALVRAGDRVEQGDLLCSLEDKDLRLERVKWASQKEQRLREYNQALSTGDRAQVRILRAQLDQAETQLALLDERLTRTRLTAPFSGFIVSGDLSQSLGIPVARGDELFQIAPLDDYRVILQVDERDVSQVTVGQTGRLVLAGLSGEVFAMRIVKLTPVSSSAEGRNVFTVEALLDGASAQLRPGMEGVGKIEIDRRRLIWIWGHKLAHWLRFWAWSWWP